MENPIWSYIFGPPAKNKALIELLKDLPVFEGVTTKELVQIERGLHQRRYVKDETVFEEGIPGAGMYIVEQGEILIRKSSGEGFIQLATIGQRSFFGEMALLDEIPRSASAIAARETTLLALPQPYLDDLKERNPKLALKIVNNIAKLVCKRLLKANCKLEEMQCKLASTAASRSNGEYIHASAS